jgi:2-C-methyl-D-erythritol 4-phosphate cytidylyltransferase
VQGAECIVQETIDRNNLWEIQTPQVFRKDLILKAYKRFGRGEVTDDAALVEKSGAKVKIVMSSYSNIKITTPEDLILAEAILKSRKS